MIWLEQGRACLPDGRYWVTSKNGWECWWRREVVKWSGWEKAEIGSVKKRKRRR